MSQEALLERISLAVKEAGLSERKALIRAEIGLDFVRDMRRRDHSPNVEKLKKLARVLNKPFSYFADVVGPDPEQSGPLRLDSVQVVGEVQGGVYREALGWADPDDAFSVTIPIDDRFPRVRRYGLIVRGNSMNLIYPDGTIVIVVQFGDLERPLKVKDKVVVLRRDPDGDGFEATLKQYDVDDRGRYVLWPRSSDPDFQTPYFLTTDDHLLTGSNSPAMPSSVQAGRLFPEEDGQEAGAADLRIVALVVGSYRPEDL